MKQKDENFYLNELNTYTRMYFDYLTLSAKEQNKDSKQYLVEFTQYCKDNIYKYAKKLLEEQITEITLTDSATLSVKICDNKILLTDDFNQIITQIDCINNTQLNNVLNELKTKNTFDIMDIAYSNLQYDYNASPELILNSCIDDISISNNKNSILQEVEEINKDINNLDTESLCKKYGIFKLNNMYFK